jgi:hypothetical protein
VREGGTSIRHDNVTFDERRNWPRAPHDIIDIHLCNTMLVSRAFYNGADTQERLFVASEIVANVSSDKAVL